MGKKNNNDDGGGHNPVDWNKVFAVAAGATSGAATTYAGLTAGDAAASAAVTNWPLILGLGVAGLGIVLYMKR